MGEYDDDYEERKILEKRKPHYYGDAVRKCLLFGSAVILWAILRDTELLQIYFLVGILAVLILAIVSGLTSPTNRTILAVSNSLSAVLFVLFEYFAVVRYMETGTIWNEIFLLREILAVTFLVAFYLSTKTLREMKR